MNSGGAISENSRRVARNTFLLYFRMLLLMFIGLFTSRVVLKALGVDNFGIYSAVGEAVSVFTFLTASISAAVSRYLAYAMGKGDGALLRRVFSTSVIIQLAFALVVILLVETLGVWFLHSQMKIPDGRMDAAEWTLQFSLGILVVNLLSVPYNATIVAHEKMGAFAVISIVEAVLKLSVALLLYVSSFDKLKTYAALMFAVALLVRLMYGLYCRKRFAEAHGRLVFDASLLREMGSFAGWNFFGSSAFVFSRQGVGSVVNVFFGVVLNAARGIASQVENIVRQFVSNILTAMNPQITKAWASGNREYCFELVRKGAKFSYLVILAFFIPLLFEAEFLLRIWLGDVPEHSAAFTRLAVIALAVDLTGNSLLTLQLARGDVRRYYLITGLTSYLVLPLSVLAFKLGASAAWAYISFIIVYSVVFVQKVVLVNRSTGFPVIRFALLLGFLALTSLVSLAVPAIVCHMMPDGWLRFVLVCLSGWLSLSAAAWLFVLTDGEKAFVLRKTARYLPDALYLRLAYRSIFGRRLHLWHPRAYTEHLQHMKIFDHNPLYRRLVDKAEVKDYVAGKIGSSHVIPTLGVWDKVSDIDFDALPDRFVLKCTHDSGSTVICASKDGFDIEAARTGLEAAMRRKFHSLAREWAYRNLKPRIIAEEYLGENPVDYKFFCFGGVPRIMFIATGRNTPQGTCFDFFDMDFNHLDILNGHPNARICPEKPLRWEEMKELAARLSNGLDSVRVDFYEKDGCVYFGEYTFYHWGGMVPFEPDEWDFKIGEWQK